MNNLEPNKQLLASNPNYSVWVMASAGTGKTKILTDRVLRLLIKENNPSKILCLTFTKAAAAEMSNRINSELACWAIAPEENLIIRLKSLLGRDPTAREKLIARRLFAKVLDAIDGLKIQTIHAFCQAILKRFPIEANISTNAKIIDDATASLLLKETAKLLLEDKNIAPHIEYISWHLYESSFLELIAEIIAHMSKIKQILKNYNFNVSNITKALAERLGFDERMLEQNFMADFSQTVAHNLAELTSLAPYLPEKFSKLLANKQYEYENFKEIFLTKEQKPRKLITQKLLKQSANAPLIITKWQELLLALQHKLNAQEVLKHTDCFLHLASAFIDKYQALKSAKYALDYQDLINIAHNLLSNANLSSWILYKLDGGLEHILLDEAQDTSAQQWQIIECLAQEFFAGEGSSKNKRTLFVVGDEKQSIFSFQGADPKNFHLMHNYFKNMDANFQSITLDISFRSTSVILNLVDQLFSEPSLQKAISGGTKVIQHQSFRHLDAGSVELWPLVRVEKNQPYSDWQLPTTRVIKEHPEDLLASLIASNILTLIQEKRFIPSRARNAHEGDIMILVRRRNEFTDKLVKELKKRHLRVAGIDRLKLSENIAIMDLIALGNFLLLPHDDLSLACLLKSPLCNMSEDDLQDLAVHRTGTLWQALAIEDTKVASYLKNLQEFSLNASPFNLFNYVLEVQDGRKKICARLGLEANDALDEFLNLCLLFEKNHLCSLQHFLHWFERSDVEIKRDLAQDNMQIRLMTVHAAKGLQAPIVILADTTTLCTNSDSLIFDDLLVWPRKMANLPEHYKLIKMQKHQENYAEYLRLLYVALTRAEDELIICGYQKNLPLPANCWYSLLAKTMKNMAKVSEFKCEEKFLPYLASNEMLLLQTPQLRTIKPAPENTNEEAQPVIFKNLLPAKNPAPIEKITAATTIEHKVDFSSPLNPNLHLLRGNLMHKLLEFSPLLKNHKAISQFIALYGKNLSHQVQEQILEQYSRLLGLEDFHLANSPARAVKLEASVAGFIKGKRISGKIDRLIITPDEVIIIDYKSDVTPALSLEEIKPEYLRQMHNYYLLIKALYPKHNIRCKLLYTSNSSVIELTSIWQKPLYQHI
jgi:ATP-dependent helicase/nuclease subunit A